MTKPYGSKWRVLARRKDGTTVEIESDGVFDELVLESILHLEQMDNRVWWMQLGDASVWIRIPAKGPPQISIEFDEYPPAAKWTINGKPMEQR